MSVVSIDNTSWIALSAFYPLDDLIDLQPSVQQNSTGYVFISHPIFSKLKDTKAGKQTLFALTSSYHLTDILTATKQIESTDLVVYTAFLANNGNYISNVDSTLYATGSSISNTELFKILKISGTNKFKIYYDKKVFTINRNTPYNVTLEDELTTDTYKTQQFGLHIDSGTGKVNIMASFEAPWWAETGTQPRYLNRFLSYSPVNSQIRAIGVITDDDYFADNNYTFTASVYIGDLTLGFNGINKFVKYYNDFDDTSNNKNVNVELSLSGIRQNILVDSPYKTSINVDHNTNIGKMNVNFTTLKNILTPDYEYTTAPVIDNNTIMSGITGSLAVKRRDYEKLFIGTNQDEGYEKPYLEYNANTKSITLETDKCTFFHYPCSAPQIALSACGLIESGAHAGGTPIRSDRLLKKSANYAKNIYWGNSLGWQRGTWYCAWLSGSENIDERPVWKDRWYNPGYVQSISAGGDYIFVNNDPVVTDINSDITFDPGVWYQYCHMGDVTNKTLVDSLTGSTGTNLKIHLDNWAETTLDESNFDNNGLLQSYDSNMIINSLDGSALKFNGINQECLVPYSSTYKTDEVSYCIWTNVKDWNNVKGNHIVSNNFRGGWNLGWSNGFKNTIIPVYDKKYGHILLHNLNGKILFDKLLPVSGADSNNINQTFGNPISIALDKNVFTWILDDNYKKLYKLDYNGDILLQQSFNTTDTLKDLTIDKNSNILVLTNNAISAFDSEMEQIQLSQSFALSSISNATKIDINKDDTIRLFTADGVVIDKNNNAYFAASGHIWKEDTIIYQNVSATDVACDSDNNIWATTYTTDFLKLSGDGTFILSGSNTNNQIVSSRSINLTNENNIDYIWISQAADGKVYKYDIDGNFITDFIISNGIDIAQYSNHNKRYMNFDMNGDPTGYDWYRKFKYLANDEEPFIEANYILGTTQAVSSVSLSYPVSNLTDRYWHHFASTYDSTSGIAKLYVDNIVRKTENVNSGLPIYYAYENPLLIGANIGKTDNIDKEFQNTEYHFDGAVDDLRIYDIPINNFDIKDIYLTKFDFKNINWNMPTGTQNYLEEIERFFKHKLPGMKSQYYNVRLVGLKITDQTTRNVIEDIIRDTVTKISPLHTELLNIVWE